MWVVVVLIVFAFFTGERKLWDLEVKFPLNPGYGRGEIELECGSKTGSRVEGEFELNDSCGDQRMDLLLNGKILHSVQIDAHSVQRFRFRDSVEFDQPSEGDSVSVQIGGVEAFFGVLVRD